MSLIDEALKRARMEAAQKAAEREGLPYPTIPRQLRPNRRAGWLVPVAVTLAVVAGVVVGLLLASRSGSAEQSVAELGLPAESPGDASRPAPVATGETGLAGDIALDPAAPDPASSPGPVAPVPTAGEPVSTPRAVAADPGEDTAANPADSEPAGKIPVSPRPSVARPADGGVEPPSTDDRPEVAPKTASPPTADRPSPAPGPASSPTADPGQPAAPAAAEPSPPATTTLTDPDSGVLLVLPERRRPVEADPAADSATEAAAESYSQQYPLANGGTIELGGIAWSETGPFALINGSVVGPGSVIEGYTLERIRPEHVLLTGNGRRIQLSLR